MQNQPCVTNEEAASTQPSHKQRGRTEKKKKKKKTIKNTLLFPGRWYGIPCKFGARYDKFGASPEHAQDLSQNDLGDDSLRTIFQTLKDRKPYIEPFMPLICDAPQALNPDPPRLFRAKGLSLKRNFCEP